MLACVAPGPRVTRQTAARPVSFPAASAMFAAAASCLVVMTRGGAAPSAAACCCACQSASSTDRKLSPGTQVHSGTWWAARHSTSAVPPVRGATPVAIGADGGIGADESTGCSGVGDVVVDSDYGERASSPFSGQNDPA